MVRDIDSSGVRDVCPIKGCPKDLKPLLPELVLYLQLSLLHVK